MIAAASGTSGPHWPKPQQPKPGTPPPRVIANIAARLAVVIGLALIAAAFTPPAPPPAAEPVHRRPATKAEDRQWQLDQLSALIDEHRAAQRH